MSRLAPPLILLAALAAGRAHAQAGDRYGPRPPPYAGAAVIPVNYGPTAPAPMLRGAAPALRSLSWPGKTELRPALSPASASIPGGWTPPAAAAPPSGRFPGMGGYAAPAPMLRTGAPAAMNTPAPSTTWPAPARTANASRRMTRAPAASPYAPYAPAPTTAYAPAAGSSALAARAPRDYAAASAPEPTWAPSAPQRGGSTLPAGLAAPPAYVPAGPAYGTALAGQARLQALAAAAPTADTLPPPTVGRYGYVGPGRAQAATAAPPLAVASAPPPPRVAAPTRPLETAAGGALGPPRPPAYARSYVLAPSTAAPAPADAQAPGAPATVAAIRPGDGGRRYSVHREYGMEPDPVPVPPQFFGATADLSAPETAPAVARGKAAVNAARLAVEP